MTDPMLRVGVIGCGAAAELVHLPALKLCKTIQITAFADSNVSRAKELSRHFPGSHPVDDFMKMIPRVDAVIITSPNFLHAPQSISCLQHGVHVFCEKPMAITLKEAKRMVKVAKEEKRILSIGMVRRYFTVYQNIKTMLDTKVLGNIVSYRCEEGYPFKWPLQSTYAFEKHKSGGGVLIDLGSHIIDMISYLFHETRIHSYHDDSYGGVEANCDVVLSHKGFHGHVRLSRERVLNNGLTIECDKGTITTSIPEFSDITITQNGKTHIQEIQHNSTKSVYKELQDFFHSATHGGAPLTSGDAVITSVELIEQCYKIKQHISEPWLTIEQ